MPLSFFANLDIRNFYFLILSSVPVFCVGFAEDLGYMMSPRKRLIASMVSGILVILLLDIWVDRLAIPGIDYLFDFALFGIAFTLFATAGVVNAFNLIDGLNGLSSFVTVSTAISISSIAFMIGEYDISIAILFVASITLGFMALNFPSAFPW